MKLRHTYFLNGRNITVSIGSFILVMLIAFSLDGFSQVSINTSGNPPDADAMLDVEATDKGVLIPRITFANRPPASKSGMLIYQTDGNAGFYYANGLNWIKVGDASQDFWQSNGIGTDIGYTGNVYIGSSGESEGHILRVQNYSSGKAAIYGTEQSGSFIYSEGMIGVLNWTGALTNPLELPMNLANIGVLGKKPANGLNGAAIYGWNDQGNTGLNYAGVFIADGPGTNTNIGVYAKADSGSVNYGVDGRAEGTGTNYGVRGWTDNGNFNYAGVFKGRVTIDGHSGSDNASDSTSTLVSIDVNHTNATNSYGVFINAAPQPGYGYGLRADAGYLALYGRAIAGGYSGTAWGVYGYSFGDVGAGNRYGVYGYGYSPGGNGSTYGIYGYAYGNSNSPAYGVYGYALGGSTNWAGYFSGDVYVSSDMRIATTTQAAGYELSVNGQIACEEVLVEDSGSWPDFVFLDDYNLMSLEDLEQNIKTNGHLPGIPSASEVEENGIMLGDMQKKVLQKVEELTLYTIEQQKMIKELQQKVEDLEKENKKLKKRDR